MTVQMSVALRNAMIGQYEPTIGAAPVVQLRTGAQPANCAAAASGTLVAKGAAPSDWLSGAANGAVGLNGNFTVTGQAGAGAGTVATHYRLMDAGETVCHEQGTVTITGGGGDMTVDNPNIANNQVTTITGWSRTQGGA